MATVSLDMDQSDFLKLVVCTQQLQPDADSELLKLKDLLWQKLDRIVDHDLYSKFKTAPTEEEREKAHQEYLNHKGIPSDFRW